MSDNRGEPSIEKHMRDKSWRFQLGRTKKLLRVDSCSLLVISLVRFIACHFSKVEENSAVVTTIYSEHEAAVGQNKTALYAMDLSKLDRQLVWHPFTQDKTDKPPTLIVRGEGSYLYDSQGNKLLDLIAAWSVNLHGHANPHIVEAIHQQCQKLEHVIFAGFTHEPAITLCKNLASILPSKLTKFFFSDDGSTTIEVALKMSVHYWRNKGQNRSMFIGVQGGYHGVTCGGMSVGMSSGYHGSYANLCFANKFVPFPETWIGDDNVAEKEEESLAVLREYLRDYGPEIAAFIVEPFVQGASGMRMCRANFLDEVVELVRKHDILVICDEVLTGFGRTGTYFAFEQTSFVPDILCLAKSLSGGFSPLALTITTLDVYQTFLGDTMAQTFMHGHSYTGNPLGCAAANASFELLTKPETMDAIRILTRTNMEEASKLTKCPLVERVRVRGTIAAFDLKGTFSMTAFKLKCKERGVLVRSVLRSVYVMPPYTVTADELRNAFGVLITTLNSM